MVVVDQRIQNDDLVARTNYLEFKCFGWYIELLRMWGAPKTSQPLYQALLTLRRAYHVFGSILVDPVELLKSAASGFVVLPFTTYVLYNHFFSGLRVVHINVGRVARAIVFGFMFRVSGLRPLSWGAHRVSHHPSKVLLTLGVPTCLVCLGS